MGECFLTEIDMLSLILAAASHDIGHSGVDNAFIHTNKTALHYLFPDVGPLE
jgi:HD-GYP domain-containing protein (c-di-GMP phosphodiesterase class II)